MPFGRFWTLCWCLLDTFWMPFGSQDVPGVHFCEFINCNDFWSVTGVKGESHVDTILLLLTTLWRSFFCCFLWLRDFLIFCSSSVHLRFNLGTFLGPLLSANALLAHHLQNGNATYVDLPMRACVGSMYEDRCGQEWGVRRWGGEEVRTACAIENDNPPSGTYK